MSDRWIFATAFLTVVLVVAGAFAVPQFFPFELAKSLIFVLIAIMVFMGENRYSFMLGIVAPALWFIVDFLLGRFVYEFRVLVTYLAGKSVPELGTPLDGLALVTQIVLLVLCLRAWRKQVPERFFGKTFGISLVVSLIYVVVLTAVYLYTIPIVGAS